MYKSEVDPYLIKPSMIDIYKVKKALNKYKHKIGKKRDLKKTLATNIH